MTLSESTGDPIHRRPHPPLPATLSESTGSPSLHHRRPYPTGEPFPPFPPTLPYRQYNPVPSGPTDTIGAVGPYQYRPTGADSPPMTCPTGSEGFPPPMTCPITPPVPTATGSFPLHHRSTLPVAATPPTPHRRGIAFAFTGYYRECSPASPATNEDFPPPSSGFF